MTRIRRTGIFKKPALLCSPAFELMCESVSKKALVDALWCACQLGTDKSEEQIRAQAARNLRIALDGRGDALPKPISAASEVAIDSDPWSAEDGGL